MWLSILPQCRYPEVAKCAPTKSSWIALWGSISILSYSFWLFDLNFYGRSHYSLHQFTFVCKECSLAKMFDDEIVIQHHMTSGTKVHWFSLYQSDCRIWERMGKMRMDTYSYSMCTWVLINKSYVSPYLCSELHWCEHKVQGVPKLMQPFQSVVSLKICHINNILHFEREI